MNNEKLPGWVDRIVAEADALRDNLNRLRIFIDTGITYNTLEDEAKKLLVAQEKVMTEYLDILIKRIEL